MTNVLIAFGLMISGWFLFAALYFLRKGTFNGYADVKKIIASVVIMLLISVLLVTVPDIGSMLKLAIGLDVNVENSKVGFVTLGLALSGIVSSQLKEPSKTKSYEKEQ
jgi:hypothetical protein